MHPAVPTALLPLQKHAQVIGATQKDPAPHCSEQSPGLSQVRWENLHARVHTHTNKTRTAGTDALPAGDKADDVAAH